MTNDPDFRTNQTMSIGDIMPFCLQNIKNQMSQHRAKTSYMAATTDQNPANPVSSVFDSLATFLVLAFLILVIFAPKSFWFALLEFFKSKPIEASEKNDKEDEEK